MRNRNEKISEPKTKAQRAGEIIKASRERLGMTQAQLAERLGCSSASVSEWERGLHLPDKSLRQKLAEILETTWEEICQGIDKGSYHDPKDYAYALYRLNEYKQRNNWIVVSIVIAFLCLCIFAFAFKFASMAGDEPAQIQFLLMITLFTFVPYPLLVYLVVTNVRQSRFQKNNRELLHCREENDDTKKPTKES